MILVSTKEEEVLPTQPALVSNTTSVVQYKARRGTSPDPKRIRRTRQPQRAASFLCASYSLIAIRWIQRLAWVHPSKAHNCSQRFSALKRRYQQRTKANPTNPPWKPR